MATGGSSDMEETGLNHELHSLEKSITSHVRLEVTKLRESLDEANSKSAAEREQLLTELHDTRRQLSQLQERLHVSEQVTAATQQRAVRENEGIYEQLIAENREDHVYQKLLKDFNQIEARRGVRYCCQRLLACSCLDSRTVSTKIVV